MRRADGRPFGAASSSTPTAVTFAPFEADRFEPVAARPHEVATFLAVFPQIVRSPFILRFDLDQFGSAEPQLVGTGKEKLPVV